MLAVGLMAMPLLVLAHAGLVKSIPGSRAALNRAPEKIELCFNEDVELKFSSVQLFAPDQSAVPLGVLAFGPAGRRCVTVAVPVRVEQTGAYTVKYKILSQDGHLVDYGYTFNLRSPAAE